VHIFYSILDMAIKHLGSSPEVSRPEREADHLHLSSAEVKNAWRCTSTPVRPHDLVLK